jgi:PAS domain S-box-containing protein
LNFAAARFLRRGRRYALIAIAISVAGWLSVTARQETGGSLRAGYAKFAPYVTIDDQGAPSGLAVQLVQQAAHRSGVRLEWIAVEDAEKALRDGQIDLFPIFTLTDERKRGLYPSTPWWEMSHSLVSLRDHPLKDPAYASGRRIAIRNLAYGTAIATSYLPGASLVPMRDSRTMVSSLCAGKVDGLLLDARLLYDALLDQPAGCADRKLLVVPLPQTSLPMATFARPAARPAASRLYAAMEQVELDGTLTALANLWFPLPQQRYVQEKLAGRQRRVLGLLFGAGALLLAAFSFAHYRRMLRMRRTAEQAWSRATLAERRFEAFMAHTPAVSFIKDFSGRIVYVNNAFERFHGVTAARATGSLDTELFGDNAAAMRTRDAEVAHGGHPVQYVLPLPGPDGAIHHLLVLKFLLAGEAAQPLLGVTAIDITEQQRAADLVAHSEGRYRLLFEEAPVAIHEIDRDGVVTRINLAGRALCGYAQDEIIGRHVSDFVAPEYREESRAAVRAKLCGVQRLAPFERQYQRKDGELLRVEVHETAILGPDSSIQGLRCCVVDLTERYQARQRLDDFALQLQENNAALARALESATEATRLKSQFLANMSHEIRTPMNGVLGMTELLIRSGLTEEQHSLALSVSQSGEHLLAIINDILDFSKIESGKLDLEAAPFDLIAVVEGAIDLMAPVTHAKGLELTCWIDPEVPAQVVGDVARVRQVLLDLLGNAVKFTSSGEVAVRLSAAGRDLVRMTVADTGIGIPEAAIPHLFAPFTQADSTTTRRFGGTGLGLAIAKSVAELMGGEIGLETSEGHGSTFWFTAALPPVAAPLPVQACPLPGAGILIVDDNATSRSILERYARSWGLRPESVADGSGALAALRARQSTGEPFDVAIVDLEMPGMDGAALLSEIAGDSSLSATPVVCLASTSLLSKGEAAASIRKPVKPAVLHECLGRILRPVSRPAPAAPTVPVPSSAAATRGRILIAEDNAINQRVARLQVRHCGFESDVVSNGEEALDALARMTYALVLMDCQMPGMDGYAATRELRRRETGARRTPVIAVTANAYATDREACLEAGMDDHLAKPVSIRDLAEMLDRWSA